jgi:hypothetical protein
MPGRPPASRIRFLASCGPAELRAAPRFGARGLPHAGSGATGTIIPTGFGSGFSQFGRERHSQSISGGDLTQAANTVSLPHRGNTACRTRHAAETNMPNTQHAEHTKSKLSKKGKANRMPTPPRAAHQHATRATRHAQHDTPNTRRTTP